MGSACSTHVVTKPPLVRPTIVIPNPPIILPKSPIIPPNSPIIAPNSPTNTYHPQESIVDINTQRRISNALALFMDKKEPFASKLEIHFALTDYRDKHTTRDKINHTNILGSNSKLKTLLPSGQRTMSTYDIQEITRRHIV
jgi:hypothetical protein